jgi:hypothetical protein
MNASHLHEQNLFGLYEIDPAGTVLYCRAEPSVNPRGDAAKLTGCNFFDEVAAFDNASEFRHRIGTFARSYSQADNFYFTCRFDDGALAVKVLLARIHERSNGDHTKSILVHIRKA